MSHKEWNKAASVASDTIVEPQNAFMSGRSPDTDSKTEVEPSDSELLLNPVVRGGELNIVEPVQRVPLVGADLGNISLKHNFSSLVPYDVDEHDADSQAPSRSWEEAETVVQQSPSIEYAFTDDQLDFLAGATYLDPLHPSVAGLVYDEGVVPSFDAVDGISFKGEDTSAYADVPTTTKHGTAVTITEADSMHTVATDDLSPLPHAFLRHPPLEELEGDTASVPVFGAAAGDASSHQGNGFVAKYSTTFSGFFDVLGGVGGEQPNYLSDAYIKSLLEDNNDLPIPVNLEEDLGASQLSTAYGEVSLDPAPGAAMLDHSFVEHDNPLYSATAGVDGVDVYGIDDVSHASQLDQLDPQSPGVLDVSLLSFAHTAIPNEAVGAVDGDQDAVHVKGASFLPGVVASLGAFEYLQPSDSAGSSLVSPGIGVDRNESEPAPNGMDIYSVAEGQLADDLKYPGDGWGNAGGLETFSRVESASFADDEQHYSSAVIQEEAVEMNTVSAAVTGVVTAEDEQEIEHGDALEGNVQEWRPEPLADAPGSEVGVGANWVPTPSEAIRDEGTSLAAACEDGEDRTPGCPSVGSQGVELETVYARELAPKVTSDQWELGPATDAVAETEGLFYLAQETTCDELLEPLVLEGEPEMKQEVTAAPPEYQEEWLTGQTEAFDASGSRHNREAESVLYSAQASSGEWETVPVAAGAGFEGVELEHGVDAANNETSEVWTSVPITTGASEGQLAAECEVCDVSEANSDDLSTVPAAAAEVWDETEGDPATYETTEMWSSVPVDAANAIDESSGANAIVSGLVAEALAVAVAREMESSAIGSEHCLPEPEMKCVEQSLSSSSEAEATPDKAVVVAATLGAFAYVQGAGSGSSSESDVETHEEIPLEETAADPQTAPVTEGTAGYETPTSSTAAAVAAVAVDQDEVAEGIAAVDRAISSEPPASAGGDLQKVEQQLAARSAASSISSSHSSNVDDNKETAEANIVQAAADAIQEPVTEVKRAVEVKSPDVDLPLKFLVPLKTPYPGLVYVDGRDAMGRPVIVINTSCIPSAKKRDSVLSFLVSVMGPIVQEPYVLVLLTCVVGPKLFTIPTGWVMSAYKSLAKPYHKNVKLVIMVQPSIVARFILAMLRPLISEKGRSKIVKVDSLLDIDKVTHGELLLDHLGEQFLKAIQSE